MYLHNRMYRGQGGGNVCSDEELGPRPSTGHAEFKLAHDEYEYTLLPRQSSLINELLEECSSREKQKQR